MPVENQDVELWVDNPFEIDIPVLDDEGQPDTNIIGAVWWVGRLDPLTGKSDVLIKKDVTNGLSISGSTLTVTGVGADTAAVRPGTYTHEAALTDNTGTIEHVTIGKLVLTATMIR
jgi:hypothetical protein